ncbi:MAG: hypothetical protein QM778_35225 [Myxococcales bacterium]
MPEDPGAPWELWGTLSDLEGRETLRMEGNAVVFSRGSWDITLEGQKLQINNGPRDVVATMTFRPEHNMVEVERLKMGLGNGYEIDGTNYGFRIHGHGWDFQIGDPLGTPVARRRSDTTFYGSCNPLEIFHAGRTYLSGCTFNGLGDDAILNLGSPRFPGY